MEKAPQRLGRVVLVLELDVDKDTPPTWTRVSLSLPGRPGSATMVWPLEKGALTAGTFEDLGAWVLNKITQGLDTLGGVQNTFFP
jgi:hypothetical protein